MNLGLTRWKLHVQQSENKNRLLLLCLSLPASRAVEVIMGWAAILVDITPGARVPAAIVGRATRPAVPTRDVMTVLPAIVMAGTKEQEKYESTSLIKSDRKMH